MKITYFGYDPLFSCLDVFLKQGHEFVVIYTGASSDFSDEMIEFANKNDIPLCFGKPSLAEMQALLVQGVELFFSAEYPWKIPIPSGLRYAINVHPTLLPEGKGMTPLPHVILTQSVYAGITLHKLSNQFDAGDILLQESISIDEYETFDSLSGKILQKTPALLSTLLSSLDDYYQNSQTQGEGSYWPSITIDQQTLNWKQPTAVLLTTLRAFGSLGTYANIAGKACLIKSANTAHGTSYQHDYSAGQVLVDNEQHITIATIDGELCIAKETLLWRPLN